MKIMVDVIRDAIRDAGGSQIGDNPNAFEIGDSNSQTDPLTGQPKECNPTVKGLWNKPSSIESLINNKQLRDKYFPDENLIFESNSNAVPNPDVKDGAFNRIDATNQDDIILLDGKDLNYTRIFNFDPIRDKLVVYGINPNNIRFESLPGSPEAASFYDSTNQNSLFGGGVIYNVSGDELAKSYCN